MSASNPNWFEWFELEPAFQLDIASLRGKYLELQRQLHPDQAQSRGESTSAAVRANSQLNDAWDTLRDPVRRAIYLLQLAGQDYDPDRQTQQDMDYLMQQMALREQLADLTVDRDDVQDQLDALREQAETELEQYGQQFEQAWEHGNYADAALSIGRMMFAQKFERDVNEREEELFDL